MSAGFLKLPRGEAFILTIVDGTLYQVNEHDSYRPDKTVEEVGMPVDYELFCSSLSVDSPLRHRPGTIYHTFSLSAYSRFYNAST